MDIRDIIRKELAKVISENYPAGAASDPSAPWNQEEPRYSGGMQAGDKEFKIAWYKDNAGFALFNDAQGNLYALAGNFDEDEMGDYGHREQFDAGQDEDGFADYEYGDYEVDEDAVENYVNGEIDAIGIGKGMGDHEDGKLALVDDELRQELLGMVGFYTEKEPKVADSLARILQGGVMNEGLATDSYIQSASEYFDKMLWSLGRLELSTGSNPDFSPEKKAEVQSVIASMKDSIKKHIKMMMDTAVPDNELAEMNMANKLVYQDRMMTPTGTLFFMNALEESENKLKNLIHGHTKDNTTRG